MKLKQLEAALQGVRPFREPKAALEQVRAAARPASPPRPRAPSPLLTHPGAAGSTPRARTWRAGWRSARRWSTGTWTGG